MSIDEKYKLSTYKEISVIIENSSKKISIVKNEVTNKLYVKKVLSGTEYFNFYVRFASLKHKNIIEIHDVVCSDGATYVFEEYINGQTLQDMLENEGIQPESKVIDYITQVCDALIYLHGQNPPIIHRDIKPENIMLSADDIIKLIDFDIAREFKQSSKRDTTFMGTKEYAAPEQYGYKQTDGRTDVYAVGVLLHEMLTGKLPQNNINYKGALQKIIVKCLRLEPEQRYQSIAALKKALANTRASRHKRMAVYALSGIAAITAIILILSNTPSASIKTVTDQTSDDSDNPDPDAMFPMQIIAEQNANDLDNPEPDESFSTQPEADQNTDDLDNPDPDESFSTQTETDQNTDDSDAPDLDEPFLAQNETDQNPAGAYNPDPDEPVFTHPVTEQISDDLDSPDPDASFPAQTEAEQNANGANNPDIDEQLLSRTLMGHKFYDVVEPFLKVEDYSEKPTIILEHKEINKLIRSITGDSYDSVARAFQEYDYSFWEAFYDFDINLLGIVTCNYKDEVRHDRLLLEISGEFMNITYYDADAETTYYFTTNDDKGLLSEKAFSWIKNYPTMFESPVVFDEPPLADVTGTYYLGNQRRIEIFEEAGEMKFSYTDIRTSKEAEPWIVETIHKLDDNHYWIRTYTGWNDKEMLFFNFSKKHLTLLNMLQDSEDVIYNIAGRGIPKAFDPKGIYDKA